VSNNAIIGQIGKPDSENMLKELVGYIYKESTNTPQVGHIYLFF
jgi:hypothetical protein